MAVLLITYKYDQKTSKADFDGFLQVIGSYRWVKLSESNYAITADEPAKAVWRIVFNSLLAGYINTAQCLTHKLDSLLSALGGLE